MPTRDELLDDIRRVTELKLDGKPKGQPPSSKHFKTHADGGVMSFSRPTFQKYLGGVGPSDWVKEATGKEIVRLRPVDITEQMLLDDIRRVTALELPDKPAGVPPQFRHFQHNGPMKHRRKTFARVLGGTPEDWVHDAVGQAIPRKRAESGAEAIKQRYLALHEKLKRLPTSTDLEIHKIDRSSIYEHFGSLERLRESLGLPGFDSSYKKGLDLVFYEGMNNYGADMLHMALVSRKIFNYTNEVEFSGDRKFRSDFVFLREQSREPTYVEIDGFGDSRFVGAYSAPSEKMEAYLELGLDLVIVSSMEFNPFYGQLMTFSEFREYLEDTQDVETSVLDDFDSNAKNSIEECAVRYCLQPIHLAWLIRHNRVPLRDGRPDADAIARVISAKADDRALSVYQMAELIGITPPTIYKLIHAGKLLPFFGLVGNDQLLHANQKEEIELLLGGEMDVDSPEGWLAVPDIAEDLGCGLTTVRRAAANAGVEVRMLRILGRASRRIGHIRAADLDVLIKFMPRKFS